jgi:hypothetical protein
MMDVTEKVIDTGRIPTVHTVRHFGAVEEVLGHIPDHRWLPINHYLTVAALPILVVSGSGPAHRIRASASSGKSSSIIGLIITHELCLEGLGSSTECSAWTPSHKTREQIGSIERTQR